MTTFETIQAEPSRDRWGRPLIIPVDGGKPTAYTRCTRFIDVLEDKYNLQKWMQRMVATGLGLRRDLHLSASSLASDPAGNKKALDDLCEAAIEAAKGSEKATIGTALHAYIERINLGQDLGVIPPEFQQHIDAYRASTSALHPIHVERFVVQDELKVGGTPDLAANIDGEEGAFVCDLKTGPATLVYGALKVAMQMAVYAHSQLYDAQTGQRSPLNVRQDKGLVIALDSDTAQCTLHWVDLAAGWEAVQVAAEVNRWRKVKGVVSDPIQLPAPALIPEPQPAPVAELSTFQRRNLEAALLAAIAASTSREALLDLWERSMHIWTDAHTEAAKRRLAALAA